MENLEVVPSEAALSGGRKSRFGTSCVTSKKALEYLEGGTEVIPKSSPLQGMKAQSLLSVFVGEVAHARYKLCSLSLNLF